MLFRKETDQTQYVSDKTALRKYFATSASPLSKRSNSETAHAHKF